jgi:hypothetical protein
MVAKGIESTKEHIKNHIKTYSGDRRVFGEVLTPLTLVGDMLDKLPNDVWSNPNLKWLDPAAGIGVFQIVIIERLMLGLSEWEPNEDIRYSHIIENMIYASELQESNVNIYKNLFGGNVFCGDTLSEKFDGHIRYIWGVEKFDIIVGNPPYNKDTNYNVEDVFKKTQPLWHAFVFKSISILMDEGYLCLVHPGGWRNISGVFKDVQRLILSKKILSLNIHSYKDGVRIFGAKTNFDYYCIQNSPSNNNKSEVVGVDGLTHNINLSRYEFITDENISKVQELVAVGEQEVVSVLHSYSAYETRKNYMSKNKVGEYIYPIVYSVTSPKSGNKPTFNYSKINTNGHFGIPKVIWGNRASGVIVDELGEYGLSQFAFAIVDSVENLLNIKKALESERFIRDIMCYRDNLGHKYNMKIIAKFRKDFWREFI